MVLNHPKMLINLRKKREISTRRPNLGKGKKSFKCHRCGDTNHIAKKCKILQHSIDLYQKSLKEAGKAK
jgi:hypothetical protein